MEKKGIPTVTIVTSAFEELARTAIKDQGVSDMALVVVEHPIAGRNSEDTKKLMDHYPSNIISPFNADQRPLEVLRDVLAKLSHLLSHSEESYI